MDIPKFGVLRDVVLYKMFMETVGGETSWFEYGDVAKLFNGAARKGYVSKCLDALVSRELVEESPAGYSINEHGIAYIERDLEKKDSVIFNYDKYGDTWLEKQSMGARDKGEPDNLSDIDLQKENWEPLPIDRESQDYQEVVSTLDEAIDIVAGNNGYAESEPDERNNIVESLRQGQTAIKKRQPSKAQINALVLQPLKYLARKFSESTIGEIAKVAAAKIVAWLMGFI